MDEPISDSASEFQKLKDRLAAERNMLRTVIDSIPDLVFVKDTQSRFVIANQAVAQAFGLDSPDQLIGKSDFDFFPDEKIKHIYADEQALIHSGQAHINHEEPNDNLGGVARWFSTTKVPLRDEQGHIIGLVAACREITEVKHHEANLERRNLELSELYGKLSQAQEQLIEAEKLAALGSLVAGVAHELNTPIGNCILSASAFADKTRGFAESYAGGLKRSVLEDYLEDCRNASDILIRNLKRAADLVTSFKHVAADQESSQRRSFSLEKIIVELLSMLVPKLRDNAVTVTLDVDAAFQLDSYPGPLQQVFMNLVDNAILHGFEGRATGAISIVAKPIGDGWLELTVSDDGCGIIHRNLGHIFDPFFTTKLGTGGSGLGLSIAHNIVSAVLGGRIRVESEVGIGSRFIIALPVVAPDMHIRSRA